MPPKKSAAAAVASPAMDEDTELTEEEQKELEGEEQPVEEAPAEPQPEPAPKAKGTKHEEAVPYDRFDQVNQQLRQVQEENARNAEYRERWARLEERQRVAAEAAQQRQLQEQQERIARERPDPSIDPVGARAWDAEQRAMRAEQQIQQLSNYVQQGQQTAQQQAATYEMQNWLAFQVPQARQFVQDYDNRVDYARATRAQWWGREFDIPDGRGGLMRVPLYPPEQARDIVAREEMALLERCKQMGIPLHMAVSALADSWGYQAWMQQQQARQNGNGQVRQAAPPQVMPNNSDRFQQVQRGQAAQGLGRVQSGESAGAVAWQTMTPEEFRAFVGNMPEDQYLEMIQDKRIGKAFERRVSQIEMGDV